MNSLIHSPLGLLLDIKNSIRYLESRFLEFVNNPETHPRNEERSWREKRYGYDKKKKLVDFEKEAKTWFRKQPFMRYVHSSAQQLYESFMTEHQYGFAVPAPAEVSVKEFPEKIVLGGYSDTDDDYYMNWFPDEPNF